MLDLLQFFIEPQLCISFLPVGVVPGDLNETYAAIALGARRLWGISHPAPPIEVK